MEGEEAERMVLVGAQQKELGVVLMMVVPRELEEAEAGVVPVESLVETEVNHKSTHCMYYPFIIISSLLSL